MAPRRPLAAVPVAVLVAALALVAGVLTAVPSAGAADEGASRGTAVPASDGQRIDVAALRATLRERRVTLPRPGGGVERFAVWRTRLMEPTLAAAHPEIRTWSGRSLDRPGTTLALDLSPLGLHASVRGPNGQGAWYVDPVRGQPGRYLVRDGAEVAADRPGFVERETRELERAVASQVAGQVAADRKPGRKVRRHVYRLALVSDPSYAAYFGSANVLAAKVTLVNRVNQVYSDDLAIGFELVAGSDALNLDTAAEATGADGPCGAAPCYDASAGQLDFCSTATLGRTRTVLGQLVGASGYDIGHLALGLNGGGVAYLGVAGADYKGGGCTGLPTPRGDFFAIDYVAHELGHQLGGNHTFNGVQSACAGGNREPSSSVEPGSGSSVMAYAGICRQDDLQPHTDPYFSQRTIDEIGGYVAAALPGVNEVQTVSLRGFDPATDQLEVSGGGGAGSRTVATYDRAGIEAAVESLTGRDVTVAQWGYDPFDSFDDAVAPPQAPDDTGFQVIFAPTPDPEVPAGQGDVPSLTVTSPSPGVSGFVGETAQGGAADNAGAVTRTRNHAPRVEAPRNRTIPTRTPFRLTGAGSDKDRRDRLTYLWEQDDPGGDRGTSLVDNTKTDGPLFRVFGTAARVSDKGALESPSPRQNKATRSPTRWFPDLHQVLRGNTNARTGRCPVVPPPPLDPAAYDPPPAKAVQCYSEFLPTRQWVGVDGSRRLHFRLTARDGNARAGGVGHDSVTLRVDPKAGPFLVTSQRTNAGYAAGARTLVTWKVNGTQRLARDVQVLLVTGPGRGGQQVLVARTANDGSVSVRLPRKPVKRARIMVAAVDNYFYAVNRLWFQIGP